MRHAGLAGLGLAAVMIVLWPADAAQAQQCTPTGANQTCTNSIFLTGGATGLLDTGTGAGLAVTNSGSGSISGTAGGGGAGYGIFSNAAVSVSNLGGISATAGVNGFAIGIVSDTAAAIVSNWGSISATVASGGASYGISSTTANVSNWGSISATDGPGGQALGIYSAAAASVSNRGSISGTGGYNGYGIYSGTTASVSNWGSISGTAGPSGQAFGISGADATVSNWGSISATAGVNGSATGIVSDPGTATVSNWGSISATGGSQGSGIVANTAANVNNWGSISGTGGMGGYGIFSNAAVNVSNWGSISATAGASGQGYGIYSVTTANIFNCGTISGTGGAAGYGIYASDTATVTNCGTILGSTAALQFNGGADTLTLLPGSRIIGAINLGTGDTIVMNAGNQNLTFNTLAGATVTGNAPYVVSGNRIASVDLTPFGIADKNLMAFAGAVWGLLGGRANAAASGGDSGPLGFAGETPSDVDDAFAQVMGYAKAPNDAAFFKNPTMTTADGTTVWAKGFYGQRTQQADGPNLRNVTQFYGGAIGLDRLVSPDLRLGGFAGGGSTSTAIDLNFGNAHSDIGFGGVYGRKDIGTMFVDFALLAGATSNRTTRNINNNLLANGLETATASFGGWFISPELAAGKRYALDTMWSLTPTVRLRYLAAGLDGYTETGSTSNLTVASRTLQNMEERGDLTLTRMETFGNADRLSTSIYAGLLGQQRVGNAGVNAILLGQALAFATPGKSSIGGIYAGGGVEWHTGRHVSMFASAEYTAMTDLSNTVTGRAGLRYGF